MKDFSFETYKKWFNKEFEKLGFFIVDDWEGQKTSGIVFYPDLIIEITQKGLNLKDLVDFEETKDLIKPLIESNEYLLPFKNENISLFEKISKMVCKECGTYDEFGEIRSITEQDLESIVSIADYMNGSLWEMYPNNKHKKSKR